MPISEHLGPDEEILSKYESGENDLYATDWRLIRYISSVFEEDMDVMQYDHIASLTVHRSGGWRAPVVGVIFALVGVFIPSYFLIAAGAVLTFFGVLYRSGHYTVKGVGGEKMKICEHRYFKGLWDSQRKGAEKFVRTVRKHIDKG